MTTIFETKRLIVKAPETSDLQHLYLLQLVPAPLEDYSIIQNMARFYAYDMSEYLGDEEG